MRTILFFLALTLSLSGFSSNDKVLSSNKMKGLAMMKLMTDAETGKKSLRKTKLVSVSLAVTLGVFGVHRLYLGTKAIVPIGYTLTLGGGMGILPVTDIVYILLAKDVEQIRNNDYLFMWNKTKKSE